MTSQVLRSCTDRHLRLVDLEANLAPLGHWVQLNASLDQHFGQVLSLRLQSVSPDSEGSTGLVSFDKLKSLRRSEHVEDHVHKARVVVEGRADILLDFLHVAGPGSVLVA